MILWFLLTAAVIGSLVFVATWRWRRRWRVLVTVVAVALLWVAEIAFIMRQHHLL